MADTRKQLMEKIDSQRANIRLHIKKYDAFKKNGDYTSSAEATIGSNQATIRSLKSKDKSIDSSFEDDWTPT